VNAMECLRVTDAQPPTSLWKTCGKPVENLWKTTETGEIQFYTACTRARRDSPIWARYIHRNVKNYVNNDRRWVERSQGDYPLTWTVHKPSTNVVRFLRSPLGLPPILFFLPTFHFGSLSGEASGNFVPYLACIRLTSGVQRLILGVV